MKSCILTEMDLVPQGWYVIPMINIVHNKIGKKNFIVGQNMVFLISENTNNIYPTRSMSYDNPRFLNSFEYGNVIYVE